MGCAESKPNPTTTVELVEKDRLIEQLRQQITHQKVQLDQQNMIQDHQRRNIEQQLRQQEGQQGQLHHQIRQLEQQKTQLTQQQRQIKQLEMQLDQKQKEIEVLKITNSSLPTPKIPVVVLPDEPNFTCNINGRNGYAYTDIYEIGKSSEDVLGKGSFGKVYRAKHKFAQNLCEERSEEDDELELIAAKRNVLFGPGHVSSTNGGIAGGKIAPRKSRYNPIDEWKGYVAIKTAEPNALDTKGGKQVISSYDDFENYCAEIKILIRLRGRNARFSPCLFLYEYFWTTTEFQMVTEVLGQELDQWRNNHVTFLERDAMAAAKQILIAMEFMHGRNVVHRDIKLQNVLFKYNSHDPSTLKIVDFGLAKVLENNETTRDFCGSLGFIAPEIYLREQYSFGVDMFAFGVLLFRLLSGERPFPSNRKDQLQKHTIELRYNVLGKDWENVSYQAKDLIRHLLIKNTLTRQERWTATQCLEHEWFSSQGTSVLRAELSIIGDRSDGETRSRAFLQTEIPTSSGISARSDSEQFWIDGALQMALVGLVSEDFYNGVVIDAKGVGPDGIICVRENNPTDDEFFALPEYISRRGVYTEEDCRHLFKQLAEAVKCMHYAGMAHRNLHMENVLATIFGKVSIQGLQYAQPIQEGKPLTGHFGYYYEQFAFKAPEVDSAFFHDESVDLWSLGAIFYMMLTGTAPFTGNAAELFEKKRNGIVKFEIFSPSEAAQDLVFNLLRVNPRERLTIDGVFTHEWMTMPSQYLESVDLSLALGIIRDWKET